MSAIAQELATGFLKEDALCDRDRCLPVEEVKKFSQSGMWGIIVPKEYGGAGVSNATLAEVIKIIAEADSSLGQIPQNHLYTVEAIRLDGTEDQKRFFFDLVLQGKRFGNAFSEIGTKSGHRCPNQANAIGRWLCAERTQILFCWGAFGSLDSHDRRR